MEIRALNIARNLIERNVVKALKTRSIYGANLVIRHQKELLPPHVYDPLLCVIVNLVAALLHCLFVVRLEFVKNLPVREIANVVRAPVRVFGLEGVFRADDFAFEEGCEAWVVFCEAWGE